MRFTNISKQKAQRLRICQTNECHKGEWCCILCLVWLQTNERRKFFSDRCPGSRMTRRYDCELRQKFIARKVLAFRLPFFFFGSHVSAFFNRVNQMTISAWSYLSRPCDSRMENGIKFSITKNWLRDFIDRHEATSAVKARKRECLRVSTVFFYCTNDFFLVDVRSMRWSTRFALQHTKNIIRVHMLWLKFNSISQIILWHRLTRKKNESFAVGRKIYFAFCLNLKMWLRFGCASLVDITWFHYAQDDNFQWLRSQRIKVAQAQHHRPDRSQYRMAVEHFHALTTDEINPNHNFNRTSYVARSWIKRINENSISFKFHNRARKSVN